MPPTSAASGPATAFPPIERAREPRFASVSAGLGISSATSQGDAALAEGFYAAGEFGVALSEWVSPRLYGGLLMTFPVQQGCQRATGCDVSDKIAFVGGKVRFLAPIPYVAPFIELGLGLSAGSFRTLDVGVDQSLATRTAAALV